MAARFAADSRPSCDAISESSHGEDQQPASEEVLLLGWTQQLLRPAAELYERDALYLAHTFVSDAKPVADSTQPFGLSSGQPKAVTQDGFLSPGQSLKRFPQYRKARLGCRLFIGG